MNEGLVGLILERATERQIDPLPTQKGMNPIRQSIDAVKEETAGPAPYDDIAMFQRDASGAVVAFGAAEQEKGGQAQ